MPTKEALAVVNNGLKCRAKEKKSVRESFGRRRSPISDTNYFWLGGDKAKVPRYGVEVMGLSWETHNCFLSPYVFDQNYGHSSPQWPLPLWSCILHQYLPPGQLHLLSLSSLPPSYRFRLRCLVRLPPSILQDRRSRFHAPKEVGYCSTFIVQGLRHSDVHDILCYARHHSSRSRHYR